jgi:hypothetical protein
MDKPDQAKGLRELFGSTTECRRIHVACLSRPALALATGAAMTKALSEIGENSLAIDEVGFAEREDWPIPAIAKYSLQQVLAGFVPLERAICGLDEHRSYVFAGKTASQQSLATLLQQRQMSEKLDLSGFRNIFHVIGSAQETSAAVHGEQPHVMCVSGVTAEDRNSLILWMIRHDIEHKPKKWGFFFLGEADEVNRAWAEFEPVASKYLSGEICLVGSASGEISSAPLVGNWVTRLDGLDRFIG